MSPRIIYGLLGLLNGIAPELFDPASWRLLGEHTRGRGRGIALCVAAAGLQSLLAVPMVPLVRIAFDRAIPKGDIVLLLIIGSGLAATRIAAAGAMVLTRAAVVGVKTGVVLDLRQDLLERLYGRPHVSHVRAHNQPFAAHIVIDADRIDAMLDQILAIALPAGLTCVLLGAAMLYLNPYLVVFGAVFLPLVWLIGRSTSARMRKNILAYHEAHDAFIRGIRFALDNFALTRARAAEREEIERRLTSMRALRAANTHLAVDNIRSAQIQSSVIALVGVAILIAGGVAVGQHVMSLGGLLGFFLAGGLAASQVDRLIATLPVVIEGVAALTRLDAHLRAAPPAPYSGGGSISWSGRVRLESVDFSYGSGLVLSDVSVDLVPGRSLAIIGPNGAGKTSIVSLILGLYRPQSGGLMADGAPYEDLDLRALRRQIGLVPQHPQFFNGSVFENIAYGAPGTTRGQVGELIEQLGAGRLLADLPEGLDAPLGETGLLLSGGQRQMIAILRALVVRPRLLILDEPTNHLDRATVRGLVATVARILQEPAILLISHDPEAVAGVDMVYRLDMGKLAPATELAA